MTMMKRLMIMKRGEGTPGGGGGGPEGDPAPAPGGRRIYPLPSAAPDPLAGHQELPQYYVEVETILCGLQMNQMSCIERALLQTMLKKSQYKQC